MPDDSLDRIEPGKRDAEASAAEAATNPDVQIFEGVSPDLLRCILPKVQQIETGLSAKYELLSLTIALLKFLKLPGVESAALSDSSTPTALEPNKKRDSE